MITKRVKLQFRNGNIQLALPVEIARVWRVDVGDSVNVYLDDTVSGEQRIIVLRESPSAPHGPAKESA